MLMCKLYTGSVCGHAIVSRRCGRCSISTYPLTQFLPYCKITYLQNTTILVVPRQNQTTGNQVTTAGKYDTNEKSEIIENVN